MWLICILIVLLLCLVEKRFGDTRRLEQRKVFKDMILHVKRENIPFLFISGDLYEQEYAKLSTVEYINNLFKEIPNTKVFISPGNHDPLLKNSFYNTFTWNENVHIFGNELGLYEFPEADIYGYGFEDFYLEGIDLSTIKIKNEDKINIFVVHGSLDASVTSEMKYNPMTTKELGKLGFDYIALRTYS